MSAGSGRADREEPTEGEGTPPEGGSALGEEPVAQPGGPGREVEEAAIPDEPLTKEPSRAPAGRPEEAEQPSAVTDEEVWERPTPAEPARTGELERDMAALAHASIVLDLASGVGLLIPIFIWLSYHDRSRFVSFHAVQALFFQVAAIATGLVLAIVAGIVLAIGVITSLFLVGVPLVVLALIILAIGLLVPLLAIAYGVYGAYQTYRGRDFRYWLIADLVGEHFGR